MALRTFLALDIDATVRERLAAVREQFSRTGAKIRWVAPQNLHVTLKFLGDARDETIAEACEIVSAAAGQIEPFDFAIRRVLCVPPAGMLRMLWAGMEETAGRMKRLYEQLSAGLGGMGLHEENRPFRPHITLARIKFAENDCELRRKAAVFAEEDFGPQRAEEVVVYTSKLTRDGPVYTPVARAKLGR